MDRNLGASRVATSMDDTEAYGDLYQWGRLADGHQNRTSQTLSSPSTTDVPGHDGFIVALDDWRSPQNDYLWQGVAGTNNPCPAGFRLPTATEWETEWVSWGSNDRAGAYASPLKLVTAGYRNNGDGMLTLDGSYGLYWSSTVNGNLSRYLVLGTNYTLMLSNYRAYGFSVRCLKD